MAIFGYARVSSADQNEDRQMIALNEQGIPPERIFIDKQSGKDFDRAAWKLLMERLKPGDLLYIKSIDRLGRNYNEIQNQWRIITKERRVDIVVIDMPILNTHRYKDLLGTLIADIVLVLLSFFAHSERDNIRKRQAEGIAAAKARGVRFGRPAKKLPEDFGILVKQWECGSLPLSALLEKTDMKPATFYRRLREFRAERSRAHECVSECAPSIVCVPDEITCSAESRHSGEAVETRQDRTESPKHNSPGQRRAAPSPCGGNNKYVAALNGQGNHGAIVSEITKSEQATANVSGTDYGARASRPHHKLIEHGHSPLPLFIKCGRDARATYTGRVKNNRIYKRLREFPPSRGTTKKYTF